MRRVADVSAGLLIGAGLVTLVGAVLPSRRVGAGDPGETGPAASPTPASLSDRGDARHGHGRDADRPADIPARGWKDILLRTYKEFSEDQVPLIAAGCTFYALLALFPAITAFVALYGLFADVAQAGEHVAALSGILPGGAISLIGDQMTRVAATGDRQLSLALVIGLGVALWSANKAMKALIIGLNIAYEESETRGFVMKIAVPLAFTVGAVVFAVSAMAMAGLGLWVSERFGPAAGQIYSVAYWAVLFAGVVTMMALLYRFGPSRRPARWRWITWGSALAAVAWLMMSAGFTLYVANFGNYDETYGTLGAAIGFMTWTWLSSMVFLMGAELNAEIEHQTARDTTKGPPKPLGRRGAVMADSVGEAP